PRLLLPLAAPEQAGPVLNRATGHLGPDPVIPRMRKKIHRFDHQPLAVDAVHDLSGIVEINAFNDHPPASKRISLIVSHQVGRRKAESRILSRSKTFSDKDQPDIGCSVRRRKTRIDALCDTRPGRYPASPRPGAKREKSKSDHRE